MSHTFITKDNLTDEFQRIIDEEKIEKEMFEGIERTSTECKNKCPFVSLNDDKFYCKKFNVGLIINNAGYLYTCGECDNFYNMAIAKIRYTTNKNI